MYYAIRKKNAVDQAWWFIDLATREADLGRSLETTILNKHKKCCEKLIKMKQKERYLSLKCLEKHRHRTIVKTLNRHD